MGDITQSDIDEAVLLVLTNGFHARRGYDAENILNPELTQKVADEAGVKIVPTLYTDALGPAESPGSNYLEMMRFNVKTITEALR